MSGVLGALNQKQDVYQAVYVNNKDKASAITINVLNKTNQLARITLAISVSGTNPSDAEFIEYEAELPPKGVLERMGILVNPGQYVVSKSSIADVNIVIYGVENGIDGETPLSIITNSGINPTYSTGSLLTNAYAANSYSLQLEADPGEETQSLSFSIIAGSLPPGLSMDSLGLISGTVSGTGYTPGKSDDVYAFIARASDTGGAYVDRAFFLRVKWADGSSSDLAAPSAAAIKALVGTPSDGAYWLTTEKQPTPFQAYIRFNYIDGGDWYLLLKVHNQGDMPSGSSYWTNTTLNNETDFNLTSGNWSKYATWNGIEFNRVMMAMTQSGTVKIPPIMVFNTARTFAEAITAAGGASAASGQNNILRADRTEPQIYNSATYHNMTNRSGPNFNDVGGAEDIMQAYGISMWANNSSNSTTAEGLSSVGRAGAWIGCPMDEGGHTFNDPSNGGADSGFGFGASTGNPAKTTSAGYSEWTNGGSTNTLPAYVWVR